VLRSGISVLPGEGSQQYALGLLLLRTQRMDEALNALNSAYRLSPQGPLFGYVYGVALDSTGAASPALNVWKQVAERHPGHRDTLQALASGLYKLGDFEQSRVVAERLADLLPGRRSVAELMEHIKAAAQGGG